MLDPGGVEESVPAGKRFTRIDRMSDAGGDIVAVVGMFVRQQ
ncbi:hypothetical protein [Nocardia nova]|nr:hypothetical protein [Nocardia nova]